MGPGGVPLRCRRQLAAASMLVAAAVGDARGCSIMLVAGHIMTQPEPGPGILAGDPSGRAHGPSQGHCHPTAGASAGKPPSQPSKRDLPASGPEDPPARRSSIRPVPQCQWRVCTDLPLPPGLDRRPTPGRARGRHWKSGVGGHWQRPETGISFRGVGTELYRSGQLETPKRHTGLRPKMGLAGTDSRSRANWQADMHRFNHRLESP